MKSENFIERVTLLNFKSIKRAGFKCARVNLIIGNPNAGKTNILEGISILGAGKSAYHHDSMSLRDLVRFSGVEDIFYNYVVEEPVMITADGHRLSLYQSSFVPGRYANLETKQPYIILQSQENAMGEELQFGVSSEGYVVFEDGVYFPTPPKVLYYKSFKPEKNGINTSSHLAAPFGNNLYYFLQSKEQEQLREDLNFILGDYGLTLRLQQRDRTVELQKDVNGVSIAYSWDLISDTLKRFLFHYCAIAGNKNAVLLFNEIETNLFPEYIKKLAEAVKENDSNQFFIVTHSPYFFQHIMDMIPQEDVAVFLAEMKDYETQVNSLPKEAIDDIKSYDLDPFYNFERLKEYV